MIFLPWNQLTRIWIWGRIIARRVGAGQSQLGSALVDFNVSNSATSAAATGDTLLLTLAVDDCETVLCAGDGHIDVFPWLRGR